MALPNVIRLDKTTWVPTAQVLAIREVAPGEVEVIVAWQDQPIRVDADYSRPILLALKMP